ncbi:MAG: hypothetical protein M3144_10540 [Actinomycetota bacterium]|nr:hypothetical protein [Actinomycetota bacterium]
MPLTLPRKAWSLVALIGVVIAVVFALIPVGVNFGDDPLLRLRQLDPQLSPPVATAVCGSPISHLTVTPEGTSLYEVARATACERASRRRLAVAVAAGLLLVTLAFTGLAAHRLQRSGRYDSQAMSSLSASRP